MYGITFYEVADNEAVFWTNGNTYRVIVSPEVRLEKRIGSNFIAIKCGSDEEVISYVLAHVLPGRSECGISWGWKDFILAMNFFKQGQESLATSNSFI